MKDKVSMLLSLSLSVLAGLFLTSLVNPSETMATGFAILVQGAREIGMLNAVVANTQGPASNFFNPALISELGGTQFEIGTTFLFPSTDFKSDLTGETWDTEGDVEYPSTLYLTYPVADSLTLGLGINTTFGLTTEWADDWEGRYIATNTELITYNINPNIVWKVTDQLSLGGGIDVLYGDGTLERKINFTLFGLPDGHQKFEGDGYGYGFNLGLLYKISSTVSFGASYRSGIDLDLELSLIHI
jgi:long-chain fatty acid transport protein